MCDMTHPYEWRDSFTCVTWLIHVLAQWLLHVNDMTHSPSCGQNPANVHILGTESRCNKPATYLQHTCRQPPSRERSYSRHCNTLQHAAPRCNTLQHTCGQPPANAHILGTAIHCNTLQHAATYCNTLKHTCGQPLANARILGAAMLAQTPLLLASVFRV